MTLQSHLTFLGFKMVIFSVKWGNSSVQHISLNFENWIRKTLTRLESSWFNWQRLVISKSNRFSLLISQLWLNSRGSRDYKYHDNRTSNQIPLSESQAEHYLYDYLGVVTISGKSDFDNFTFILLKKFCSAVLEMTPKLASPHLLMRLLVDYAAVLSVLHHREPEGARVLCDTWSLQKISHQEFVLISEKHQFVVNFRTIPTRPPHDVDVLGRPSLSPIPWPGSGGRSRTRTVPSSGALIQTRIFWTQW